MSDSVGLECYIANGIEETRHRSSHLKDGKCFSRSEKGNSHEARRENESWASFYRPFSGRATKEFRARRMVTWVPTGGGITSRDRRTRFARRDSRPSGCPPCGREPPAF